jgi:HK97 family phage portal protein
VARNPFRRPQRPPEQATGNVRGEDGTWYGQHTTGAGATRTALSAMGPEEQRSISIPWNIGDALLSNSVSTDTALSLAAVYSATDLLATSVATLPLKAYRRTPDGQRICLPRLPPLWQLMIMNGTLVIWLRQCMTSLLLRGNAYGLITSRDTFGYPTQIIWLDPDWVSVQDTLLSGRGSYTNPIWYYAGAELATENLLHIPWYVQPQHTQGLSPLAAFATTIGVGLDAQRYGRDWFGSGGFPPGTFVNSEVTVTQDEATAIAGRLIAAMRARRPLVYGKDWAYTPITVPPEEAQFVQTMQLSATQIAAIYHVPAEWIGGSTGGGGLHYSTAEQDMTQMVTLGVRPYLELLESVFFPLMPEKTYVRFDTDALIRADTKTRHEVYAIDAAIGLRSIDEMRAAEEWEPHPETVSEQDSDGAAGTLSPRELAEMIQKLYLGVGTVITWEEAREILNGAGADLDLTVPAPNQPEPLMSAGDVPVPGDEPPDPAPDGSEGLPTLNGRRVRPHETVR